MGTSVCKQCVRYKDNCFQSSSSENGNIYIRKTTNDKKYCDTKPRSSSISANATYSSTFNKTAGFWNSWESINTIRSKSEKDRSSDLSRIKSVGKMFDTKLPYKSSPRIERECITDNTLIENGGTDSRYQEGRQLKNHPSSNSFRDLQTCSNESENARIDLYRRNVMGNYETNGIYTEIEQSEDSSRSSSSSGSTSSSNKSENGHLQVYQEYFVDAVPSTSASHGNRTKNTVNGNGFMKSSKIPAEEKLDLHESDVETSLVTHMENIVPIVAGSGDIESSINSGNDSTEREKQFSTKVQSVCKGAVPRTSPTSPSRMQEDRQKPKYLYEVKGAGLDLKNITAEVSVNRNINYSTRRDNGDNVYKCCLHVTPPPKKLDTNEGRLNTYKNWPNNNIDPKKLAAAGFFYSGKTDIVECFICGIKGHNWLKNDDPMEDHRKWNRNCPFVRENTPQTLKGSDYCGNLGVTHTETEEPAAYYRNLGVNISPHLQNNANTKESETSESHNLEGLLLRTRKGPSHPDQIIFESRLATFVNWPKSMKQKPAELAAAGFYYLGIGDQTLCFYCGGGLKDWVEEDDPWEQHALWFPKCNYVLLKKTPAFVKSVQDQHKSNSSSKQHETEEEPSCSSTSENHEESSSAAVEERERNNKDESSTLCKICYKNELAVVFLPCGHMVACVDCASGLKECAICRKEIQANVRAFLS